MLYLGFVDIPLLLCTSFHLFDDILAGSARFFCIEYHQTTSTALCIDLLARAQFHEAVKQKLLLCKFLG